MELTLLAIPLVTGLIGWGTNALAIQMIFKPLRRRGWSFLSWQGIIPAHAERMARICVQLMTRHLLDVDALFQRLRPVRISALISPTLETRAEGIVEEALSRRMPRLWEKLPERMRQKIRERLRSEIPQVVRKLFGDLGESLQQYLDLEAMVVEAFVRDRALLNELFWRCGRREFLFIARSGLLFGLLFGLVQAGIWLLVQPDWFLPITGLLVGWATNWLALKMIFEPQNPRQLGPWVWQGLFLKRQQEVSEAYAAFFAERILYPEALIEAVMRGPASEQITELLQAYVHEAVEQASGHAGSLVQLAIGAEGWGKLKEEISASLVEIIPEELNRLHDYADEALALEQELRENLQALPPAEFELVLRPLFQEDESTLIAVGTALGGVAGVLQWVLVTQL